MASVVFSGCALDQLQRAVESRRQEGPAAAGAAVRAITAAATLVGGNPLVGRRVQGEIRELVISVGPTGYLALYRFVPLQDEVRILAIRHQRELHYRP
jgi:plasmid stabilization system protein ParE